MTDKPSIARAILLSFLGLVLFYLASFLAALILGIVVLLLYKVPGLSIVAKWLARFLTEDSFLVPLCGYFSALTIINKLAKDKDTADLTCILLGAYLLIISVICLVLNLIYGNSIWINILYGIAGIVFIVRKSEDAD